MRWSMIYLSEHARMTNRALFDLCHISRSHYISVVTLDLMTWEPSQQHTSSFFCSYFRLLVISSDTVGVWIVKNNKIGQYLHIRQCQVMGLAVEATNTLPVHKNLENIISDSERVRHNYCTVPKLAKISIKQWNVCRVCMSAWLCMGVSSPVLCLWYCSWSSELLHMWWWFHTGYNHMTDRCYCWQGDSPYSPASLKCMAGRTDEYVACWW